MIKSGKVKYFNPAAFHGMITVDEFDKEVYVNTQEIHEEATYLPRSA